MRYPILLAHGIARFDILLKPDNQDRLDGLHYWRNIRALFQSQGCTVHHTSVDWSGRVAKRAGQLAEQARGILDALPAEDRKIHLVAHSMGGLDARHAIVHEGLAPFVSSLTTLGTPHHGTSFADWGESTGLVGRLSKFLDLIQLDIQGLKDLTTHACRARNEEFAEFESLNVHGIDYRTWAGVQEEINIFWPLILPYRLIRRREGPNDGLVPESSARWKDEYHQGTLDLDHLNLLGWWDSGEFYSGRGYRQFEQEIRDFYLRILEQLRESEQGDMRVGLS